MDKARDITALSIGFMDGVRTAISNRVLALASREVIEVTVILCRQSPYCVTIV